MSVNLLFNNLAEEEEDDADGSEDEEAAFESESKALGEINKSVSSSCSSFIRL